jgi:capsule polysaccharide modification protein KpsS
VRYHFHAFVAGILRFQGRKKQKFFDGVFSKKWSGKYYFVPLQVHTDSQITERSDFKSIEEFIQRVVVSFKLHAPKGTKLVFKVHPMDRGYKDYHELIQKLKTTLAAHRLLYLDRIHLPTVLEHARACITINSSVGLSALTQGTPVITLGEAAFDLEGLTYQGSLDDFWSEYGEVNTGLVKKYVSLLKRTSQAQGTLYQKLYAAKGACKIQWPMIFESVFNHDTNRALTTTQVVSNSKAT